MGVLLSSQGAAHGLRWGTAGLPEVSRSQAELTRKDLQFKRASSLSTTSLFLRNKTN